MKQRIPLKHTNVIVYLKPLRYIHSDALCSKVSPSLTPPLSLRFL